MSKPLELTVYPWVDRWVDWTENFRGQTIHGSSREYGYETPRGVFCGDDFPEKRLTDAELAAELWFGTAREGHAEAMGWRTGHAQDWINTNREECRIVAILERFATLPHYDEAAE